MWPHQQTQSGYPYPRQHPQPPPPLNMPQNLQQQQYPYDPQPQLPQYQPPPYDMPQPPSSIPPSPREEAGREKDVDYSSLPGPKDKCNEWHGYIYALEWVQQPIRARMCGFGDKDRRPISPPPCIRLKVLDKLTMKEVDPNTIELSFFVLTVDLWDKEGHTEKNLVKHNQVSPSISTATTTAYPPTISHAPPTHSMPQPFDPANIPNYRGATNTQPHNGYTFPPIPNDSSGQMYGNRYDDNRFTGQGYGAAQNGYGMLQSNGYGGLPGVSSLTSNSSMPSPYGQPRRGYRDEDINSPQTAGMFTRNLIGSTSTSASLLKDERKVPGIWFILQDLSVRTEDWFRLKASFVNLGEIGHPGMPGNGQPQVLTKGTAPVLATIFSRPFQVFSAKKFPGVIESTELSKTFAAQGVKIPIRKENGGKLSRSNNDDDDEDE